MDAASEAEDFAAWVASSKAKKEKGGKSREERIAAEMEGLNTNKGDAR